MVYADRERRYRKDGRKVTLLEQCYVGRKISMQAYCRGHESAKVNRKWRGLSQTTIENGR